MNYKTCKVNDVIYTLNMGWWVGDNESTINPMLMNNVEYNDDILIPTELSKKELEQFSYHLNAMSYNDIADVMGVSLPTIKHRASVIIEKYNFIAKNMHELVIIYYKNLLRIKNDTI